MTIEDLLKFLQIQEEIHTTKSENEKNVENTYSKLFVCDLEGVMQLYPTKELLGMVEMTSDLKGLKMKNEPPGPSDPFSCKYLYYWSVCTCTLSSCTYIILALYMYLILKRNISILIQILIRCYG